MNGQGGQYEFHLSSRFGEDRMTARSDWMNFAGSKTLWSILTCWLLLLSGGVMESPLHSDEKPKKETALVPRSELLKRFIGEFRQGSQEGVDGGHKGVSPFYHKFPKIGVDRGQPQDAPKRENGLSLK